MSNTPNDATLWSFTGIELIPVSGELTLLLDPRTGTRQLVKRELGIALTHCETFRTLTAHAEHLVATLPQLGGQVAPVVPVLEQIRDVGLLTTGEDALGRLLTDSPNATLPPVEVFIISCDRPTAVARLLASMAAAPSRDLPQSYTLIDDSRDPEAIAKNQQLVNTHNANNDFTVQYFGLAEREQLITALIGACPQHEASIRFLLDRAHWGDLPTYGLSRTLAILLGTGKRVVVYDDDVLCEAVRAPLPGMGVQFGSITGRSAKFWESAPAQAPDKRPMPDNPTALITRQLGQTLGHGLKSLTHGSASPHSVANANGAFLGSLTAHSKILQTQCGTWGDPGTSGGHWIAELDLESIDRLLGTPGGVTNAVDARACWLGYATPTLTKTGVMSQVTGYDATQLLPPFLPALRGEDSLFAYMLIAMHPDGVVLNHDWAIPHQPLDVRDRRGLKGAIPALGGLNLLTRWIGDNVSLNKARSPEQQLQALADSIANLANLNEEQLFAFGRGELARLHAAQLEIYRRQLDHAASLQSANWSQYLERGYSELLTALQTEPTIADLMGAESPLNGEQLNDVRAKGAAFAEALRAWPEIWTASCDIRKVY